MGSYGGLETPGQVGQISLWSKTMTRQYTDTIRRKSSMGFPWLWDTRLMMPRVENGLCVVPGRDWETGAMTSSGTTASISVVSGRRVAKRANRLYRLARGFCPHFPRTRLGSARSTSPLDDPRGKAHATVRRYITNRRPALIWTSPCRFGDRTTDLREPCHELGTRPAIVQVNTPRNLGVAKCHAARSEFLPLDGNGISSHAETSGEYSGSAACRPTVNRKTPHPIRIRSVDGGALGTPLEVLVPTFDDKIDCTLSYSV